VCKSQGLAQEVAVVAVIDPGLDVVAIATISSPFLFGDSVWIVEGVADTNSKTYSFSGICYFYICYSISI
jgi:hypothetical protein